MTPLAQRITRELTLPRASRTFVDAHGLLPKMENVHCFEVTQVLPAAGALAAQFMADALKIGAGSFLPAPRTWIEWRHSDGSGYINGALIEEVRGSDGRPHKGIVVMAVNGRAGEQWGTWTRGAIDLQGALIPGGPRTCYFEGFGAEQRREEIWQHCLLQAFLALINTPRIVGRTTHMPHAGLQRSLARSRGMVGKFPLHAWTEIKLSIRPPVVAEGDDEIHLTGSKALHFVRCHLRIRLGKLELVSAHWRGDPALGIKRSRYALVN